MRTLYLDIESSPNIAHVWGLFNQNVSLAQLMESQRMICFSAKWRGEAKTHFYSEYHDGREQMIAHAWQFLNDADVVVGYNSKGYDIPHLSREFLVNEMRPPAPFQHVDLYLAIRRKFKFASTKLAYVTEALSLPTKVQNGGHKLWVECMAGDPTAWAKMKRYSKQDVVVLEPLHDRLMPWLGNQSVNLRLYGGDIEGCPTCSSSDIKKEGFAFTSLGKYQRYSCKQCGAWFKDSRSEIRAGGSAL